MLRSEEDGTDGTILARHYTVYETNRHLQFPYWDTARTTPLLPIEVTAFDDSGQVDRSSTRWTRPARRRAAACPPACREGTDQTHYVRWTRLEHDDVTGELLATHTYHDIPSSGYGTKDTNYAETAYGYDAQGRQDRVVAPGGTITRSVFDSLGRFASQWVGTDDVPTSGDWSPTNNSGANMTKVAEYEYDLGASGGNGNRTKEIRYLSDAVEANARVTRYRYDWRDRQVFVIDAQEYDSQGHLLPRGTGQHGPGHQERTVLRRGRRREFSHRRHGRRRRPAARPQRVALRQAGPRLSEQDLCGQSRPTAPWATPW